jgi:hypothetical protein
MKKLMLMLCLVLAVFVVSCDGIFEGDGLDKKATMQGKIQKDDGGVSVSGQVGVDGDVVMQGEGKVQENGDKVSISAQVGGKEKKANKELGYEKKEIAKGKYVYLKKGTKTPFASQTNKGSWTVD